MANKMTWLSGEVKHKEAITKVDRILEDLAREVVSQKWIPYPKNIYDDIWTFDIKREIRLKTPYKKDNIRMFQATPEDGDFKKGDELVQDVDYIVINDIIVGKGDSNLGKSGIGDKVFIEVNYEAEEFQRLTFLEERLPSGAIEVVAKLKSRPQGKISIFKDTIAKVVDEDLQQEGDNMIFRFSRSPVSNSNNANHKLTIKVDGVTKKVDEDFTMDYFRGIAIFNQALDNPTSVTATYGHRTGIRGDELEASKYQIFGDRIIDKSGKTLKDLDIVVEVDYYWKLHYPERIEDIKDGDRIVLKTTVDVSSARDWSKGKDYYWELKRYDSSNEIDSLTGLQSRFGATLGKEDNTTLDDKLSSDWRKWAWYKGQISKDNGVILDDQLGVSMWFTFTMEHMAVVIQGNPTPDLGVSNEKNYIVSFAYLGALETYKDSLQEDYVNNFAYTISSDILPMAEGEYSTKWGKNTGTGVTDILMEKTLSNVPYQAHYPSIHTTPEFMRKHFIEASTSTGKHNLSKITVVHPYERERGEMQSILMGDKSSLFHLDKLISDKDNEDYRGVLLNEEKNFRNECGKAVTSKEKHWLTFNINAPYWLANNSPNIHYGISLRTQ